MTTITKDQALAMIGALAKASVRCYRAHNERVRINQSKALRDETRAAKQLFRAITGEEATEHEIGEALGL